MNSVELVAAINLLSEQMEHRPDDLHEIHLKLQQLLNELRATGMPLPGDIVELERRLAADVEGIGQDGAS